MQSPRRFVTFLLVGAAVFLWCAPTPRATAQPATTVEVYATGLINPKGLTFAPDGTLYIAEAGPPGDVSVALPSGYGGKGPIGRNGRVSRVPPRGQREDFISGLPNIGIYGGIEMLGATGLAVLDNQLYEVAAAHMTISPLLSRVRPDGTMVTVADVGAFNAANPPPPSNGDALPSGNPYDLIALGGALYISDGNYNRVIKATPDGSLSTLAQWEESPVTVGMAAGPDGNLYVAQFSPEPYIPGTGRIDLVTQQGRVTEGVLGNLTSPIDIAFGPDGAMYVVQFAGQFDAARRRYIPFTGAVLRVTGARTAEPIVTNLAFPTAITVGPDGALYVTNYGNESNDGRGQVLRIVPGAMAARGPELGLPTDPIRAGTPESRRPPSPPASQASPAPDRKTVTVNIVEPGDPRQWGYDPQAISINAGDSVTFRNTGQVVHTATHSGGRFDTGLVKGGESATVVFARGGTFEFFCQPHPWMKGTITVQGDSAAEDAAPVTFKTEDPPAVSLVQAFGLVGLLVAAVVGARFLMRRGGGAHGQPPETEEQG